MTHGLSAVWRVTDLYGKWVTINSSIVRWKKLNCSSQVVIVYKCSQLTSESADAKAAFSFVVKRLTTARWIFPVSSMASYEGLSKTILWSDVPNVSRTAGVSYTGSILVHSLSRMALLRVAVLSVRKNMSRNWLKSPIKMIPQSGWRLKMPSSVAIIYSRMLLLSELGGWYMHAITMLANLLGNLRSSNRIHITSCSLSSISRSLSYGTVAAT